MMILRVVHVESQLAGVDRRSLHCGHPTHPCVPTARGPARTVALVRFVRSELCLLINCGLMANINIEVCAVHNVERVDILPFHQMGRFKGKELRLNYMLHNVVPPSSSMVEAVCSQFRGVAFQLAAFSSRPRVESTTDISSFQDFTNDCAPSS